ncbi:hypothetical protein [Streptosporangium minutum]|uniref:MmyB family transcriptional regulator n=1 Tax=Streptosporangium minutum TaxID=569862 RepID=UPI003BF9FBA8
MPSRRVRQTVTQLLETLRHPEAGTMTLSHEGLSLNRAPGRRLIVHMAPGSPDHDAMTLLDLATSDPSGGSGETAPVSASRRQGCPDSVTPSGGAA